MEFACLQHLDMIKLRLGFGEFYLISELLQKQYCKVKAKNFSWIFAGWIFFLDSRRSSSQDDSTTKIHFKAVIIDIFIWKINTFLRLPNVDCGCASMSQSKRVHTIYVL